jgi:hypothetical protein
LPAPSEREPSRALPRQKKVFDKLISKKQRLTAKAYEGYRSIREFQREKENTTDEQIMELLKAAKLSFYREKTF